MLRKITPILFLFTVILSSCSKDDDDVAPAQASIEGTWTLNGIDLVVDSKVFPVTAQSLEDNYYTNSVYEFKSDGTFVITDFEEDSYEGTYSFDASGNTLTLVEDGDEVTYLVQVDGSSLVLSSPTIDVNKEETTEEEDFWLFSFFFLSFDQEGTIEGEGDAISMDFKFTK